MTPGGARFGGKHTQRRDLAAGLHRGLNLLALLNEAVVVAATVLNLGITFVNTVVRYVFNSGLTWAGDMSSILIAICTFLGAAAFVRRGSGMAYTALVDSAQGTTRDAMLSLSLSTVIGVCGVSLWVFPTFFAGQLRQTLPVLGISDGIAGIWLGIGLLLMIVFTLEKLFALPWRGLLLGLAATLLASLIVYALRLAYYEGSIQTDPLLPIAVLLLVSFLSGTSIGIILALGGLLYFVVTNAVDMLNAVQLGTQSMLITVPAWFSSFVHQMDVFNLPFLISSPDKLRDIFSTPFGQRLAGYCSAANFKLLGAWLTGPRQMVNNVRPITVPKDLQGIKLRVIASQVFIDTFRLLGANPVVMDTSEVYLGLQQHVIDGLENPWTDIVTGKFYEVAKYLSNTAHMTDFFIPAMNQHLWDSLNPAEQGMVTAAMKKATDWQWSEQPKALTAALAKLKTVMTVNDLTADQHAAFVQATRPIYAKFQPSFGKDLVDQAIKTLS